MVSLSNSFVHDEDERDLDEVRKAILDVLASVNLDATADEDGVIRLAPTANTWSRQARRAAQRAAQTADGSAAGTGEVSGAQPETPAGQEPLFRACLSFTQPEAAVSAEIGAEDGAESGAEDGAEAVPKSTPKARATLDWQWGRDRTIVDAFWKFVIQKAGLRKRKQPDTEGPAEKKSKAAATDEEQQTNNPYLQHQENPYLSHAHGGARGQGRGRGRGGRRGAFGGGRGHGGYSRPQDQGWARRQ